jgi:SnoaL-like protein
MKIWTRIICSLAVVLLGQSVLSQPAQAQDDKAALVAIIDAVAKGWEQADGTPFRKHYLDFEGARYIEGGGQNEGLTDLIEHHVEPEGDALDSLTLVFSDIETHIEGDFAWAVATTNISATVKKDKKVFNNRGYETFLFRRVDGEWKVVHTHSSSRPVVKEAGNEH